MLLAQIKNAAIKGLLSHQQHKNYGKMILVPSLDTLSNPMVEDLNFKQFFASDCREQISPSWSGTTAVKTLSIILRERVRRR
jgi:hypothetical protein